MKLMKLLEEIAIADIINPESVAKVKSSINAPHIVATTASAGHRAGMIIKGSLDKREDRPNNIMQNSRWFFFNLQNDGVITAPYGDYRLTKFRKTKVATVEMAIQKINAYLAAQK